MVTYAAAGRTALVAVIAAAGLTACSEYMDRKNTIAFSAGNAVQTNVVTHVIDPWPRYVRNTNISHSGERMARAVRCYELGPKRSDGEGGSSGGMVVNVNASASTSGASASGSAAETQC